jgi:hypothetical protein
LSKGRAPLWRTFRQIAMVLFAAIVPQPDLEVLRTKSYRVGYRLREPPRRRMLQAMPCSSALLLS